MAINQQIKYVLLPLDTEILTLANKNELSNEFVVNIPEIKLLLESEMQEAPSVVAQLKSLV